LQAGDEEYGFNGALKRPPSSDLQAGDEEYGFKGNIVHYVGEGLTSEKVWAGIQELRESQKETGRQMKETERIIKEMQRETGGSGS
jgi:hypothetical protein